MLNINHETKVFKFLYVAELWAKELDVSMWTVARKMAEGTKGDPEGIRQPLLVHHVSMLKNDGENNPEGSFRNRFTIPAIDSLINDAPDHGNSLISQGLYDCCIAKQNFRFWCIGRYPLPAFWFSEKERTTLSEAERVTIKRAGRIDLLPEAENFSALGFSIDEKLFKEINKIKVFISYAKEDYKTAKRVYEDLKHFGAVPWLDREDLLPGQNWQTVIKNEIQDCSHFIALLSTNSISKKGYVQRELKIALKNIDLIPFNSVYIIPARLDDCKPFEEILQNLQWVDLFPSYENGISKILQTLIASIEDLSF